ncbi:MAG: cytochrome c-type biogenesis protein CcmH [Anaerolineales bacterium]|nr:cytochrome c-type biogenesis protein CcmH [Anaerolineales bacterium]MBP6208270.1 cytochrome c-type biogenesis protein CcmH [Anaerolineales bacterium]MBP8163839.1 cytochrome c-type biogenesis protein CcmH [Anaerolineales bacterium]
MKKFLYTLAFMLLFSLFTGVAFAQEPTPSDDEVNAVAHQLYCPVCESTPLDVCPTEACRQWRDLIRQQLADGMTEAEIKQYFVDNYGARVLAEPPKQGTYWLFYLLPPIIILAGAFILFRSMKSWTKKSAVVPASNNEVSSEKPKDDYISQFEEELKKRK